LFLTFLVLVVQLLPVVISTLPARVVNYPDVSVVLLPSVVVEADHNLV
jgi:hypothetical protein